MSSSSGVTKNQQRRTWEDGHHVRGMRIRNGIEGPCDGKSREATAEQALWHQPCNGSH
eukprot:CAMPEP_0182922970 /NCGR_PEP_ID=MMETSP0105_2-20130417/5144_1 /TAXON_ID=81532 ORGANISM="Acanthoeca-like sp., Strain 10tr" /NCGR_SAMPLE_ID=MMETSP0105_2 /ASSEMBLY_ACC=CAM_ASM_000205 /LENGTH=57 /DNA_ID=CAMNT_0025060641 /DNA_START=208 /DNA_END=381 /DNA_ORIENTATION=+